MSIRRAKSARWRGAVEALKTAASDGGVVGRVRDYKMQATHEQKIFLADAGTGEHEWRVKIVTAAKPDGLARVAVLLETQHIVPLRLVARRAPVRGGSIMVLEIEFEFPRPDLAPRAFDDFIAILAALPTVLSVVVPDPGNQDEHAPHASPE
jgi:hypothetical protein